MSGAPITYPSLRGPERIPSLAVPRRVAGSLRQRQVERVSLTGRGVDDAGGRRRATVDAEGQGGPACASGDRIGSDGREDVLRGVVRAPHPRDSTAGAADVRL